MVAGLPIPATNGVEGEEQRDTESTDLAGRGREGRIRHHRAGRVGMQPPPNTAHFASAGEMSQLVQHWHGACDKYEYPVKLRGTNIHNQDLHSTIAVLSEKDCLTPWTT